MKNKINFVEVTVTWEDATVYFEAQELADAIKLTPIVKYTKGWLISEDKKYVRVASEVDERGIFQQVSVIPKTWRIEIKRKARKQS
jgi:hypothetical protein